MKPFKEFKSGNKRVRIFEESTGQEEFNWHLDKKDRVVTVLEAGDNWGVQFDNQLPKKLNVGDKFAVPAFVWHRVICGENRLIIHIEE